MHSQKEKIIDSKQLGETIFQFKENSVERIFFPKIYNLSKASWIDFYYSKIEVIKFIDARIYSESDFIVTKDGAIWEKYYKPQWSKIIPLDRALLKIKNHSIYIKKPKQIKTIEYGFSLCGVHSTVWAHFLVQYLPKLYLLKEILSLTNPPLTVILPLYKDTQIREIVYQYLSQFQNIKIKELELDEVVNCEVLYHIENTSFLSDHANYINPSDCIIPKFTIELLKNNLINPLIENEKNINDNTQHSLRKLYISRSGYRNMTNNNEVEQYFVSQGFEVIHPHILTIKEKVKVFREAKIIVGPFSSGFTNILFCKPGVKALGFINFQRTYDSYISTLAINFAIDVMLVTGFDQNDSVHSSFFIPLEKIKSAYHELIYEHLL